MNTIATPIYPMQDFYNQICKKTEVVIEQQLKMRQERFETRKEREMQRLQEIDDAINALVDDIISKFKPIVSESLENNRMSANIFTYKKGEIFNGYPIVFLTRGPKHERDYFKKRGIDTFITRLKNRLAPFQLSHWYPGPAIGNVIEVFWN